jgi:hypothetical protein
VIFTIIFVVVVTAAFLWRTANPAVLIEETKLKFLYSSLLMSLTPIVILLGHDGGKITHL